MAATFASLIYVNSSSGKVNVVVDVYFLLRILLSLLFSL